MKKNFPVLANFQIKKDGEYKGSFVGENLRDFIKQGKKNKLMLIETTEGSMILIADDGENK